MEHIEIMMQKLTAALCLKYLTEIKNILSIRLYLVFVGISFIICLVLSMIFFAIKNIALFQPVIQIIQQEQQYQQQQYFSMKI